jgi:hypothetical protein
MARRASALRRVPPNCWDGHCGLHAAAAALKGLGRCAQCADAAGCPGRLAAGACRAVASIAVARAWHPAIQVAPGSAHRVAADSAHREYFCDSGTCCCCCPADCPGFDLKPYNASLLTWTQPRPPQVPYACNAAISQQRLRTDAIQPLTGHDSCVHAFTCGTPEPSGHPAQHYRSIAGTHDAQAPLAACVVILGGELSGASR